MAFLEEGLTSARVAILQGTTVDAIRTIEPHQSVDEDWRQRSYPFM